MDLRARASASRVVEVVGEVRGRCWARGSGLVCRRWPWWWWSRNLGRRDLVEACVLRGARKVAGYTV